MGNFPFSVIPVLDTGIHRWCRSLHGCRIKSGMTVCGFELFYQFSRGNPGI